MNPIPGEPYITLHVQILPKSSRDEILGFVNGKLKIKVAAPPEDGKANDRLKEIISEVFDVPKSKVKIIRGKISRLKTILIEGITKHKYDYIVNRFTN